MAACQDVCYGLLLIEISGLLSNADLHIVDLSGKFYQVTYLLWNTTKIVLFYLKVSFWNVPEHLGLVTAEDCSF